MNIKLQNISPAEAIISIEGEIGIDENLQFADDGGVVAGDKISTYERFSNRIAAIVDAGAERLKVEIRSAGGSVQDALLIHAALAALSERGVEISTHCYGFTASAATIIAQAASAGKRHVASSAMYLIHNSSAAVEGNADDVAGMASLLEKTDGQIAAIYAARSGRDAGHFADIMGRAAGRGEWLTPSQALAAGLVDVVENTSPLKNIANQVKAFLQRILSDVSNVKMPSDVEISAALTLVDAEPTVTENRQDPSIESDVVKLTHNQNSYSQDLYAFRG